MTEKRIGIDTGGTFTDLVCFDIETGELSSLKVPSTPNNALEAFVGAIIQTNVDLDDVDGLVHGTTVATNAFIQRTGATVGFICTAGHEDIAYIQRVNRQYLYDLTWDKPIPLLRSRKHCIGVQERVNSKGEIVVPLEQSTIDDLCETIKSQHFDALAICLLFSYLNTSHEEMLSKALRERFPEMPISVSHEIAPIWREYERSSTTIADAYVKPLIQKYVASLQYGLHDLGFRKPWSIMKSNGGLTDANAAALQPIHLAMSGPAGGAVASQRISTLLGMSNMVTLDVGGTSADIGMVLDGKIGFTTEYEIEWGIPAAIPLVDIKTIGAGGGSIASVNAGGFLQVGPNSAGAVPGPICYGRGGSEITLTDANLMLGRLDPDYFLGGAMKLDTTNLHKEMIRMLGLLGMTESQLSLAVIQIANENMANAIRMVSIERGHDPRNFALLAFGGAGPLHGAAIARKLGIPKVIVPPYPGGFCALGLLMGDLRVDKVWTQAFRSDRVTPEEVIERFDLIAESALSDLSQQGFNGVPQLMHAINMRYLGQNYEMEVFVPPLHSSNPISARDQLEAAYLAFNRQHEAMYKYSMNAEVIEMISFKVTAIGPISHPTLPRARTVGEDVTRSRIVVFEEYGAVPCAIKRRSSMSINQPFDGPLIIEEDGSTTLVEPEMTVVRNEQDILILETQT